MNILITGCNGGLGEALVWSLAKKRNITIIATARKKSFEIIKKRFSKHNNIVCYEIDLLESEKFKEQIRRIQKEVGKIDILINNAAITYRAVVEHSTESDEKRSFQTNYFSPRELIRCVLPSMKLSGGGKIINISSVGGMMAMPTMSTYSASKWSLEGMSEALYYELKPFNVKVSLVQIGFVKSNSFENTIRTALSENHNSEIYNKYYTTMGKFINICMKSTPYTPEKIAERIYNKIINKENPPLRISGTFDATFFSIFRRILPRNMYHYILYQSLPFRIRKKRSLTKDKNHI